MKLTITKSIFVLTLFSLFLSFNLSSQSLIEVEVSNNTFNPSSITINQGDTVRWTNVQGNHNVNGTTATFPSNPEEFGNEVGSGWTYEFIFNTVGSYDYQCDPHASLGMTGDITVMLPTGIANVLSTPELVKSIYPNPADTYTYIELNQALNTPREDLQIVVYNLVGKNIHSQKVIDSDIFKLDTSNWSKGTYVFQIISNKNILDSGKIIKL